MSTRTIASLFGPTLIAMFFASSAAGQVQRTFVSGLGNDGNPCSRTAPCRTFGQAIMQTSGGGEVIVLDSAGYGTFAISKAISITAPPGVYAGISSFSGHGITIDAGSTDTVILRGLTLSSQGSNGDGIKFNTGGTLHVENCVVNGFTGGTAVAFLSSGNLEVKDSIFRGNFAGIVVISSPGKSTAAIDQVRLEGNSFGLVANEGSKVTVRNSLASGGTAGFASASANSDAVEMNVENCVATNNDTGMEAQSGSTGVATLRVSNSVVTDNAIGLKNFGTPAVLLSRGNNTVEGNGTDTSGSVGSYSGK